MPQGAAAATTQHWGEEVCALLPEGDSGNGSQKAESLQGRFNSRSGRGFTP